MVSRRKKALILIALAVAVVIPAGLIYARLTNGDPIESGLYFKAIPLHEKPDNCWNLTDPDEFVLEAIRNPNVWVWVNQTTETYTRQMLEHGRSENVCYEGSYYCIVAINVDNWASLRRAVPEE